MFPVWKDEKLILKKNFSFLSLTSQKKINAFFKLDSQSQKNESSQLKISNSKSNFPTAQWDNRYLHSRFNPQQEAERKIADLSKNIFADSKKSQSIIYLGGDFLYLLEELTKFNEKKNLDFIVYLIYYNWDCFISFFSKRDLSFLKLFKGVEVFFLHEPLQQFFNQLNNCFTSFPKIIYNEIWLQEPIFQNFKELIAKQSKAKISAIITQYYFEKRWLKNILSNLGESHRVHSFDSLEKKYSQQSAILIGAGVSLYQQINFLKKAHSTSWLIAVDTALPVLIENGIHPDFVIALDGGYANLADFFQLPHQKTRLITIASLYPWVIRNFKGKIYYFYFNSQDNQTTQFSAKIIKSMVKFLNIKNWSGLNLEASNVSIIALQLIIKMGFKKVIFSGIDFNHPFFQNHVSSTMHHRYYLNKSNRFLPLETFEFKETYTRMSENDKYDFKNNPSYNITTYLLKNSLEKMKKIITTHQTIEWQQLQSNFSSPLATTLPLLSQNGSKICRSLIKDNSKKIIDKQEKLLVFFKAINEQSMKLENKITKGYEQGKINEEFLNALLKADNNLETNNLLRSIYEIARIIYSNNLHQQIRELRNTMAMIRRKNQLFINKFNQSSIQ